MYRPLAHNEHVIVSRTIYEERGLDGGLAESMFMAYKARAMALDAAEFEIFQESEIERKQMQLEKQRGQALDQPIPVEELAPMEFLRKLEALSEQDEKKVRAHANTYEWFFGDESLLDARYKRLRVLFFNSARYRKQVLRRYLEDGIIDGVDDVAVIKHTLHEFYRKYPGTRQGIISNYETFFGDSSGFCYSMAMEREAFHNDPAVRAQFLKTRNLPEGWGIEEIKLYLKEDALKTGSVTVEQIKQWEAVR